MNTVQIRGCEIAFVAEGPADGPVALCLHGFPDSAATWSTLTPALVEQGYRVIAPWLRGYAPTAVPSDGCYQPGAYAADACALHEAVGGDSRAVLIGHDIGAVAAYRAAVAEPDRWSAVITLSVPPAAELAAGMATYDQLRRSWYTFLFQHPAADAIAAAPGFLEGLLADWSPQWDSTPVLDDARAALRSDANFAAAIAYYRAGFNPQTWDPELARFESADAPSQPWLYLHGERDGCIGAEVAALVHGAVMVPDAGHFPHREQPDFVNKAIVKFLA